MHEHTKRETKQASSISVVSALKHGEANAVRAEELIRLLGLKDQRQLQLLISKERDSGALILSTCRGHGGYYLPATGGEGRAEIERFIRTIHSRAVNSQRILRTARRALRNCEGQEGI